MSDVRTSQHLRCETILTKRIKEILVQIIKEIWKTTYTKARAAYIVAVEKFTGIRVLKIILEMAAFTVHVRTLEVDLAEN